MTGILVVVAYQQGKNSGLREQENSDKARFDTYLKEILVRDRQIGNLQTQLEGLNELNGSYLSLMLKIPSIVQRLNASQQFNEVITSVIGLVKDVISTDTVEISIYDAEKNFLKKLAVGQGEDKEDDTGYAMGEGLVGMAAQNRMLQLKDHIPKGRREPLDRTDLWMAVPINFNDRLVGVIGIGEVKKQTGNESNFLKMIADIAGVVLVNQAMIEKTKYMADTDPLTGLHNRRYFLRMSQHLAEKAIRSSSPISVFLFDLDNFKHYNDTNGHDAGDILLKELSRVILEVTRKTSVVARYGGEEFIVLLPDIAKEDAFIYAERLRVKISSHAFQYADKQPLGCVSISGGIASFPADGGSIQAIIQLADAALYQAKAEGRNRIKKHQPFFFSETEQ